MASPIRWFRKHSQFFIVVFGVVLMAIFGLGSVMSSLNPGDFAGNNEVENPVIAEWAEGELTEFDLFKLRQNHFASLRFLRNVYQYAIDQNDGQVFQVSAQQIQPIAMGEANPTNTAYNSEILNRYLLAQRAKREGFVVDDAMVFQYIRQFGGETPLSRDNLQELNREVNNNVSLTTIVRHLQTELLWQQMEYMTDGGLAFDTNNQMAMNAISPTEAIELFERANRKVECRVLPVSVEDYVSKVGEPSAVEMKSLYEQGKYQYRSLNFDEPGFKQLKKARIQYFVAELDTFLQNEMAKLTDEEVQAEYDRLIEAGDNLVMQLVPEKSDENSDNEESELDPEESLNGTTDESAAESNDDPAPAPGDDATDTESRPDDSDDDGNSSNGGYTSIRLQDEESENQESTQSETAAEEPADSDLGANNEVPETSKVESEQTNQQEEESASNGDNIEESTEDSQTDPVIEDDQPNREPKPLQDVAEDIKRRMKTQEAREARDKVVEELEKELRKYQMKLNKWEFEIERKKDETIEKPSLPDFKALSEKYGIQFLETELIDRTQIVDEKIGKVVRFEIVNQRPIQIDIGEEIFNQFETTSLYQPAMADDFATSSKLIYWLAEKVDQKVPSFEEAEDDIKKFWKRNKAVEMAMEYAEGVAEELNKKGAQLAETHAENSKETGAFSWFSTFGRFAYGAPEGVIEPGDEFMEKAFELKLNDSGAAMNEPRDTAYVIQVTSLDDSQLERLGTEYLEKNFFMTKQIPREVISAKALYRQRMNFEWLREFNKTMDVKVVGQ